LRGKEGLRSVACPFRHELHRSDDAPRDLLVIPNCSRELKITRLLRRKNPRPVSRDFNPKSLSGIQDLSFSFFSPLPGWDLPVICDASIQLQLKGLKGRDQREKRSRGSTAGEERATGDRKGSLNGKRDQVRSSYVEGERNGAGQV